LSGHGVLPAGFPPLPWPPALNPAEMNANAFEKYLKQGLNILAIGNDKQPEKGRCWKHLQTSPISSKQTYRYRQGDFHGFGLVCGFGGLEALDFDNKDGLAAKRFAGWKKEVSFSSSLPIEKTPSGGYHVLWRYSWVEDKKVLLRDEAEHAAIELQGIGSYLIVNPTPGYVPIRGNFAEIPEITLEQRAELITSALSLNPQNLTANTTPWDVFNEQGGDEALKLLHEIGWKSAGTYYLTRPGKNCNASATFGKVGKNIFYPFTTNGGPFEPNKAYKPVDILAIVKFSGDYSEAAKYLVRSGFGTKPFRPFGRILC